MAITPENSPDTWSTWQPLPDWDDLPENPEDD